MNNLEFDTLTPQDMIRHSYLQFKNNVALSTRFGVQSAILLHMITQIEPTIKVIFIDTGYLFPETYQYAEELTLLLNINLHTYTPLRTSAHQEAIEGKRWQMSLKKLERI